MNLYKERVYRDVLKYSFGNRVIDQWNSLPESVINANSIHMFKNRLDIFFSLLWESKEHQLISVLLAKGKA